MPRARKELTDTAVRKLGPPARGQVERCDALGPGFGIGIPEKGAKSWVLMCRINGRRRRAALGTYPAISLAEARDPARDIKIQAKRGLDPVEEERRRKAEAQRQPMGFKAMAQLFIERYAKKRTGSWKQAEPIFGNASV